MASTSSGNGSNGSKIWPYIAGGIAAWSFLIEPYVDRTQDLKDSIVMAATINKEHVEMRYADNRRDIDKLDARLSQMVIDEQKRNNEIGEKLAAVIKVNQLFEADKLRMNGGGH